MKRLLYLVLFVIVFEPMIIGQSYLPLSGGTITGPFFVSYPSGRIITGDGTNNLVIGSWDGVNNRIESTPGRPMLITSYGSSLSLGMSGSSAITINSSGNTSFTGSLLSSFDGGNGVTDYFKAFNTNSGVYAGAGYRMQTPASPNAWQMFTRSNTLVFGIDGIADFITVNSSGNTTFSGYAEANGLKLKGGNGLQLYNSANNTWATIGFNGSNISLNYPLLSDQSATFSTSVAYNTPNDQLVLNGTMNGGSSTNPAYYGGIKITSGNYDMSYIRHIQTNPYSSWTNRLAFFTMNGNGGTPIERMAIDNSGNVGIGTTSPTEKLSVNGNIKSKKLIVTQSGWADYVFRPNYNLRTLTEIEKYIKTHQHLPDIPTEQQVKENGVDIGDTQVLLLKKIEELTLYIITQDKKMRELTRRIKQLEIKDKK